MHIVDGLATVIPTNIKCIFIIFYYSIKNELFELVLLLIYACLYPRA
jgi:hypothetical protein